MSLLLVSLLLVTIEMRVHEGLQGLLVPCCIAVFTSVFTTSVFTTSFLLLVTLLLVSYLLVPCRIRGEEEGKEEVVGGMEREKSWKIRQREREKACARARERHNLNRNVKAPPGWRPFY